MLNVSCHIEKTLISLLGGWYECETAEWLTAHTSARMRPHQGGNKEGNEKRPSEWKMKLKFPKFQTFCQIDYHTPTKLKCVASSKEEELLLKIKKVRKFIERMKR